MFCRCFSIPVPSQAVIELQSASNKGLLSDRYVLNYNASASAFRSGCPHDGFIRNPREAARLLRPVLLQALLQRYFMQLALRSCAVIRSAYGEADRQSEILLFSQARNTVGKTTWVRKF